MISWRTLTEQDFPLLGSWLAQPHVARWWHHESSAAAVARDFGAAARGEEPSDDLLVFLDGRPVGLLQRSRYGDYPEHAAELAPIIEVPAEAVCLDYFIGDPRLIGAGLGTRVIRSIVEATWHDYPEAPSIVVPVSAANRASWRALEKAGLRRVAEGEMTPDNPLDDRDHYVYEAVRPPAGF
ncbi:GNAT family N-acetyltransferase [Saccharopolyspora gloriosae]|uniref:Lysine N-acyltransferase MbtK n=1 Tax=Saccharopolyspora gloriosae TaxID=455344 RepID=A0A840NBX0_9PSEU|nr:GNAT family N-acetyltransferase [Saccharopolyspora gloriosae]MBB5069786.1 aminoglycoside 6'-N-acetyltransferase [Saccharopolyspora gloriosae]